MNCFKNICILPLLVLILVMDLKAQSITDMDPDDAPTIDASVRINNAARIPAAGVMFYTDQDALEQDCENLASSTTEDFEDNLSADNNAESGPAPLNASTNDGVFATGAIASGFEFDVSDSGRYLLFTTPFFGVGDDVVGPQSSIHHSRMNFDPGFNFVSFNMQQRNDGGNSAEDFMIEVYGTSGLLGNTTISVGMMRWC